MTCRLAIAARRSMNTTADAAGELHAVVDFVALAGIDRRRAGVEVTWRGEEARRGSVSAASIIRVCRLASLAAAGDMRERFSAHRARAAKL